MNGFALFDCFIFYFQVDSSLSPDSLRTMIFHECRLTPSQTLAPSQHSLQPSPPHTPSPRSPPSNSPPPVSSEDTRSEDTRSEDTRSEDTHTLDEILSMADCSRTGSSPVTTAVTLQIEEDQMSSSSSSFKSGSVEDLNMRNLRNSHENLMSSSSVYNILQLGVEEVPELDEEVTTQKELQQHCEEKEVDEKETAEPSAEKLEEDKELEEIIESYDNTSSSRTPGLSTQSPAVFKSPSNPKPALLSQSDPYRLRVCLDHTPPRALSPSCNHCIYVSDDEEFKEKKILGLETASGGGTLSKVKADDMESEKNEHDLDEMYRLPTEHLREDNNHRDYSNQRLKHKHLSKLNMRQLLRYREEIHELNERIREEGACGGYAEDNEEELDDTTDLTQVMSDGRIVLTSAGATLYSNERMTTQLNNEQRLSASAGAARNTQIDGFSSPEEQPSSPRQQQQQQTGARPKKSPRKQKAL